MVRWWRRVRLFAGIVWREIEPRGCRIPDEYRIRGRFSAKLAWQIACDVWD